MKRQLFILDRDLLKAMPDKEVALTFLDMVSLGIAKPPFDEFAIECPAGAILGDGEKTWDALAEEGDETAKLIIERPMRVTFESAGKQGSALVEITIFWKDGRWRNIYDMAVAAGTGKAELDNIFKDLKECAGALGRLLIVALATRNVERRTRHNRLAKFGIGKKAHGADYEYVTTISMGPIIEYEDGKPVATGDIRRPHLRRGHIRNQHYGPHNQYSKKVWIEPIFVNGYVPADDHRRAYNVSLPIHHGEKTS